MVGYDSNPTRSKTIVGIWSRVIWVSWLKTNGRIGGLVVCRSIVYRDSFFFTEFFSNVLSSLGAAWGCVHSIGLIDPVLGWFECMSQFLLWFTRVWIALVFAGMALGLELARLELNGSIWVALDSCRFIPVSSCVHFCISFGLFCNEFCRNIIVVCVGHGTVPMSWLSLLRG